MVALVIGGCTMVASCLVGYLAYHVNREMFFRRAAKENLAIARAVVNYIEERPPADDETARARSIKEIRAFWKRFDPPTSEAFLCVVTPEGEMVICTAHTNMEGAVVNDLALGKSSIPDATTIGDLLSTKQDFYAEDATLMGERQLVGFAYSNTLDHGVMVHFPTAQIESEVAAASLPWSVGIGVVAGLLIPLSLGLLHRSNSSAQRAALRSAMDRSDISRALDAEYGDLYENSPDMYVSVDAGSARIQRCNQTLVTALGYSKEDIVGRCVFDLYHPDSVEAATRSFDALVKTGEVGDAELQLKRRDGSPLDVSLNVSAVRDEHGTILFRRFCWRDITDRKRTETALRRLVEVSSRRIGESFLESTALELAITLGADYTFIGELQQKERKSIRSLASVADGKLVANCEYDLAGTPCENVVRKSVCSHPSGVAETFPKDTVLKQMGVQGYVGVPLVDSQQTVLGIVSALFRKPIAKADFAESILQIYSSRIGSEMERLRSDKALVESEERYRAIAEDMPVLLCRFLPGGEITYVNEAYCKCFARSTDELVGQSFVSLIPEADRETVLATVSALTVDSPTQSHEHQVIAPGGELRWQRWTNRALFDAEGRAVAYQSIGEDITERKRIEEALQESEERLRLMMQQSPSVIEVYDVNGLQVDVNKAYEDLWGFPADHTVNLFNVLESEQVEATGLMAYVKRAYAGEPVKVPEYEFDSRGQTEARGRGRSRWLNTRIYPLKDSEGTVHHIVITHEDITDRKCAEEERRELEAQLGQSQKMEAIGQLAGGVAHDFNNILTAIVGYTELSLRSVLRAELATDTSVVASLEAVQKAVFRAASLTKQLLVFSRHDVARPVILSITASLTGMEQMLRRLIPEDIVLEVEGPPDLGHVRVDSGQIEQVIMNLVVNARDAMPQGGKVTLEAANVELDDAYLAGHPDAAVGPHVMLAVSDTGCGIEKSNLERVFEPFYTTKPPGSGTGLGLAMVHAIIKRAGGHLTVDSEVGRGTSFRVYLPTIDEPIQEDRPDVATAVEHTGQETLLVCEDNLAVRNMIIQVLREAGYTVLGAETATQAREFAKELGHALHLLITDVVMPEMNGKKLSETLTAALPELRTLFISGYTSDIVGPHGVLGERVELLEKPFGRDVLLQRVRDVLDKPEKADG